MKICIKHKLFFICLVLVLLNIVAYEPLRHNGFVDYDDIDYVTENNYVLKGISLQGIKWAFTDTKLTANWHPLTWLSHMLDVELFGLNAFWHHIVNLSFHITNTLLLFAIFNKMTKAFWKSFFVSVLFAIHPLRVESVAWVSERKDILCGFFWLLTIYAYYYYSEKSSIFRYLVILLFFCLGLLTKPMLVTLPFILLLMDYWPLERLRLERRCIKKTIYNIAVEKIPLLLISIVFCVITFFAQEKSGAMLRGENYSLVTRFSNAVVAYMEYITKLFYPVELAVLYPHPGSSLPYWYILTALILLIAVTILFCFLNKKPILFGWFWYVGTLIPVIGIVQVGSQAMADRYTYLPMIGINIIIAWGFPVLLKKLKYKNTLIGLTGCLFLITLIICTRIQLSHWKDTLTLYKHTLGVTKNNYVVHNNYGCALQDKGEIELAIKHFNEALRIKPDYVGALNNLGMALRNQGKNTQATIYLKKVLEIQPLHPNANANLGLALAQTGHYEEAIKHFNNTLQIDPYFPNVNNILGIIYYRTGNLLLAEDNLKKAIKLEPENVKAMNYLGVVYAQQGKIEEAIEKWKEILLIEPSFFEAYTNLAFAMVKIGRHDLAIDYFEKALTQAPDNPEILKELANSYAKTCNYRQAIKNAERALELSVNDSNGELADEIKKQLKVYRDNFSNPNK